MMRKDREIYVSVNRHQCCARYGTNADNIRAMSLNLLRIRVEEFAISATSRRDE